MNVNLGEFQNWLSMLGAEILEPFHQIEILRFRTDRGIGVISKRKVGMSWNEIARDARKAFLAGQTPRLVEKLVGRSKKTDRRVLAVARRDGFGCWFECGVMLDTGTATMEHLCSITHGGPDHIANLVLACFDCNVAAGFLSIAEKVRVRDANRERRRQEAVLEPVLPENDASTAPSGIIGDHLCAVLEPGKAGNQGAISAAQKTSQKSQQPIAPPFIEV